MLATTKSSLFGLIKKSFHIGKRRIIDFLVKECKIFIRLN